MSCSRTCGPDMARAMSVHGTGLAILPIGHPDQ
jgi:hypothetical protein